MKNLWLRFGCFLTGYNYHILKSCSEASAKMVKKYTSALIVVMILWAFVGYTFSQQYLRLNEIQSAIVAFVMVIIVLQIERQVIMTVGKNKIAYVFRMGIAIIMAILGSVIIDQLIFKEDIEKRKYLNIDSEVSSLLPERQREINAMITDLDSTLQKKDGERTELINEITLNPTIQMPQYTTKRVPRRINKQVLVNGELTTMEVDTVVIEREYVSKAEQNPKAQILPQLDNQISELRTKRDALFSQKSTIRDDIEKELIERVAFLDELEVMLDILTSSKVSLYCKSSA